MKNRRNIKLKINGGSRDPAIHHRHLRRSHRLTPTGSRTTSTLKPSLQISAPSFQSHPSSLNHELVELINRDYTDFFSPGTKSVDVDGTANSSQGAPREDLVVRRLLLARLQDRLRQRAEVSYAREILELLPDTFLAISQCRSRNLLRSCPVCRVIGPMGMLLQLKRVILVMVLPHGTMRPVQI